MYSGKSLLGKTYGAVKGCVGSIPGHTSNFSNPDRKENQQVTPE